jgi:hypothetical protein
LPRSPFLPLGSLLLPRSPFLPPLGHILEPQCPILRFPVEPPDLQCGNAKANQDKGQ